MRFVDIENLWTVDVTALSNADRGRVYHERAKQVISDALADPAKRKFALAGTRFRRDYLVHKIGSQPAVTTQNPKIRKLLYDTDEQLSKETERVRAVGRRTPGSQLSEVAELKATIDFLRRRVEVQAAEITGLHNKLRECGWPESELVDYEWSPW